MAWGGNHGPQRSFSRRVATLALLGTLLVGQACYHYRLSPPDPSPETEWRGRTVHSLFWGLVQQNVEADNCLDDVIDQVRVTTNVGFALLTIGTLGFWAPVRMEWRCASIEPPPGEIPEQAGHGK